jgi:hypothetical protein
MMFRELFKASERWFFAVILALVILGVILTLVS